MLRCMSDNSSAAQRSGAIAAVLVLVALVLLPWGLWLGLYAENPGCGSPWSPKQETAADAQLADSLGIPDNFAAACQTAFGARGTIGGVMTTIGGLSALGALLVVVQRPRPAKDVSGS